MLPRALCAALLVTLPACAPGASPTADAAEPILLGERATGYPESVLVDMMRVTHRAAYCSGVLVAPRVVLTAGHCVFGFDSWRITAPFASGQTATANRGVTYDWDEVSEIVNPSEHDLGLVFLDTPIVLDGYPDIADQPLDIGADVVNVGRIRDGHFSREQLFVSLPLPVTEAAGAGFAYDYFALDVIEPGDSGGPDFIASTHTLVAVNSGSGAGHEILARVDLLAPWLRQQVIANGGNVLRLEGTDGVESE